MLLAIIFDNYAEYGIFFNYLCRILHKLLILSKEYSQKEKNDAMYYLKKAPLPDAIEHMAIPMVLGIRVRPVRHKMTYRPYLLKRIEQVWCQGRQLCILLLALSLVQD